MSKKRDPDEPELSPYTIVVDTREQAPFQFLNYKCDADKQYRPLIVKQVVDTLETGDYSLRGYECNISIERKSLEDAYSTFSQGRDRFERELARLQAMDRAAVVIEADWPSILSRRCPDCHGVGQRFEEDQTGFELKISRVMIAEFMAMRLANVVRMLEPSGRWYPCDRCRGSGQIQPLDHTKFSPKSFFRSVLAWQNRFPNVHWETCETKSFAETWTLRKLERFWYDEQEKLKERGMA